MSAEPLPAPLKIPEVSRFINRANQLRTIKPALAYWCEYHAVNQIVSKSLHTTDDDCFAYTKSLIERLEATKGERADDDAIIDNTAGQAYVEQFAQETFTRAERTLRANKVTRQTADTFDAAATFFDLTHEWGTPDADVLKKIKFAKWNAARILKAIREGKDPNESNPVIQEDELEQPLNPDDPAVQQLISPGAGPSAPSVEDVPDAGEPRGLPPPPAAQEDYFPPGSGGPAEPFVPSPLSQSPGPGSAGLSAPPAQVSPVRSPDARSPVIQVPPQPSPQIPTKVPSQYAPPPPEPSGPAASQPTWSPPPTSPHVPPSGGPGPGTGPFSSLPSHPAATSPPVVPPPFHNPIPAASPPPPPPPAQPYAATTALSHKSIEQAQKHAKFAISALNFEDVSTAVQELRTALAMLGAQ